MIIGLDLDGTLISCYHRHTKLLGIILKAYGFSIDLDDFWKLKREGLSNYDALLRLGFQRDTAQKIHQLWVYQIESLPFLDFDIPYLGVYQRLEALQKEGNILHLISSRKNKFLGHYQVKCLQLEPFLETVTFINTAIGETKEEVFSKLNLDCYVGDTEEDYKSSIKAGCQPILVTSGMRSPQFLQQFSQAPIFGSLMDIKKFHFQ